MSLSGMYEGIMADRHRDSFELKTLSLGEKAVILPVPKKEVFPR